MEGRMKIKTVLDRGKSGGLRHKENDRERRERQTLNRARRRTIRTVLKSELRRELKTP